VCSRQLFLSDKTNPESIDPGLSLVHLVLLYAITPTNLKPESLGLLHPLANQAVEESKEGMYCIHSKPIASPLEAILQVMSIGMSLAETPVPLIPLQINTLGCRLVLDLLIKVANLSTLGRRMKRMQSLGIVSHDVLPDIRACDPLGKSIGQGTEGKESKDFGELHCVMPEDDGLIVGGGGWVGL
jgi:hypothetical protein